MIVGNHPIDHTQVKHTGSREGKSWRGHVRTCLRVVLQKRCSFSSLRFLHFLPAFVNDKICPQRNLIMVINVGLVSNGHCPIPSRFINKCPSLLGLRMSIKSVHRESIESPPRVSIECPSNVHRVSI